MPVYTFYNADTFTFCMEKNDIRWAEKYLIELEREREGMIKRGGVWEGKVEPNTQRIDQGKKKRVKNINKINLLFDEKKRISQNHASNNISRSIYVLHVYLKVMRKKRQVDRAARKRKK